MLIFYAYFKYCQHSREIRKAKEFKQFDKDIAVNKASRNNKRKLYDK